MGNRFFNTGGESGELPRRLYARTERVEPEVSRRDVPVTIYFDCVSADWVDASGAEPELTRAPLSVVALRTARRSMLLDALDAAENTRWYELQLTDERTRYPVRHHGSLFDAGAGRFLERARPVPRQIFVLLNRIASIRDFPDADRDEIAAVLQVPEAEGAAVYDVGQGNCNALLSNGTPALYFDFGGGVLGNTHTFPASLQRFCTWHRPPVVLSHLDWDHWSSAARFPEIKGHFWIVPRQPVPGLIHKAFLAELSLSGRLLLWPEDLPSVSTGRIRIERCTGSGRNHSGLAMIASDPYSTGDTMLFPGDARYSAIPAAKRRRHIAVVVSHHGGDVRSRRGPRRAGYGNDRAVFSYGMNNSYRHPSPASEALHGEWPVWFDTSARSRDPATGHEVPAHVGLFWNHLRGATRNKVCGAHHCDLSIVQF